MIDESTIHRSKIRFWSLIKPDETKESMNGTVNYSMPKMQLGRKISLAPKFRKKVKLRK